MPDSEVMRMALAATKEAAAATVAAMTASADAKVALAQIAGHEGRCSERYDRLNSLMDILNGRQWSFTLLLFGNLLAAVGGLVGVVFVLMHK